VEGGWANKTLATRMETVSASLPPESSPNTTAPYYSSDSEPKAAGPRGPGQYARGPADYAVQIDYGAPVSIWTQLEQVIPFAGVVSVESTPTAPSGDSAVVLVMDVGESVIGCDAEYRSFMVF
jgi:hypothetical protein